MSLNPELFTQISFLVLSSITIGSAWGVIRSRTVFVSALWLILSFVGVAGLYVMLGAGFLAVVQILVYVGAISVLILFAIMLTEDVMGDAKPTAQWPLAALVVLPLFGFFGMMAYTTDWQLTNGSIAPVEGIPISEELAGTLPVALDAPAMTDGTAPAADSAAAMPYVLPGQVAMLGKSLMTEHLLAFEIVAVILLVALIGAIVIARD